MKTVLYVRHLCNRNQTWQVWFNIWHFSIHFNSFVSIKKVNKDLRIQFHTTFPSDTFPSILNNRFTEGDADYAGHQITVGQGDININYVYKIYVVYVCILKTAIAF